MTAALVQICSDPRLNHETIRFQVRDKLERLGLRADRIFILNEIGGNLGENLRNTLNLVLRRYEPVVFGAVLHHDDCLAAQERQRHPLETTAASLSSLFLGHNVHAPVATGQIVTDNSAVVWTDEPARSYENFSFRMPSMLGR